MTLTFTIGADQCDHCRGSADGCAARKLFANGEPCCRRCSHSDDPADNECPPNNALMVHPFGWDKPTATPGLVGHPSPPCADLFSQEKELSD